MSKEAMTVAQAQKHFGRCPRPCDVCAPKGHHWYLNFRGAEGDEIWCICKHCTAEFLADPDDRNLPEI